MTIEDAQSLIQPAVSQPGPKATWAELGSGSGTFTLALASCLGSGSDILAIDKSRSALQQIPNHFKGVRIRTQKGNFEQIILPQALDGILMANALHYVKRQPEFLLRSLAHLDKQGQLLLIEYDTDRANPWVPHPISFRRLQDLMEDIDPYAVEKIGTRPSRYQRGGMYAAQIRRKDVNPVFPL